MSEEKVHYSSFDDSVENNKIDVIHDRITELLKEAKNATETLKQIYRQVNQIHNMLDNVGEKKYVNRLVIMKNNSENPNHYDYTAFRVHDESYTSSLGRHLDKYPNLEKILDIKENPNIPNLWMRVKDELDDKFKNIKGHNFDLKQNYSEKQLIKYIKQVNKELND
jgi:hypothetical protein